jgi:hypothetical protein
MKEIISRSMASRPASLGRTPGGRCHSNCAVIPSRSRSSVPNRAARPVPPTHRPGDVTNGHTTAFEGNRAPASSSTAITSTTARRPARMFTTVPGDVGRRGLPVGIDHVADVGEAPHCEPSPSSGNGAAEGGLAQTVKDMSGRWAGP